jgi:hypothetical protein
MKLPFGSQRHLESDYDKYNTDVRVAENRDKMNEISRVMKERAVRQGTTSAAAKVKSPLGEQQQPAAPAAAAASSSSAAAAAVAEVAAVETTPVKEVTTSDLVAIERRETEERIKRHLLRTTPSASEDSASLALSKIHREIIRKTHDVPVPDTKEDFALKVRDKYGVVKTTSDYVLYEDRTFSVMRVLDVPPDSAIMPRLTFEEEEEIIAAVDAAYKDKLERLRADRRKQRKDADEASLVSPEEERMLMRQKKAAADEAMLVARDFWRPGVELMPRGGSFPSHHIPLVADIAWNKRSFTRDDDQWRSMK